MRVHSRNRNTSKLEIGNSELTYMVWVSFAEIYNENAYDLLEKLPEVLITVLHSCGSKWIWPGFGYDLREKTRSDRQEKQCGSKWPNPLFLSKILILILLKDRTIYNDVDPDPVGSAFIWVRGSGTGSRGLKWMEKQSLTNIVFFFLFFSYTS